MKNKNSLLSLGLISIPLIPLSAACTNGRKVDNLDTSKEEKVPQEVLNAIKTKKEELLPLETEANSLLELNDGSNYELNKSKSKVKEQIKKITSFLAKTKTLEELSNLDQLKNDLQTYIQELKATKVTQIQGDINRLKSLKKEVEQYINTELIDEEYDEIKKSLKEHLLETNNLINEDVYKVTKPQVVANYIALNKELAKAKLAKKEIVDNANYKINKLKANLNSKIIQYREFADEKFNDEIRIEFLSTLNKTIDVKKVEKDNEYTIVTFDADFGKFDLNVFNSVIYFDNQTNAIKKIIFNQVSYTKEGVSEKSKIPYKSTPEFATWELTFTSYKDKLLFSSFAVKAKVRLEFEEKTYIYFSEENFLRTGIQNKHIKKEDRIDVEKPFFEYVTPHKQGEAKFLLTKEEQEFINQ